MIIGISPILSPEIVAILMRMGHGDELVLADAHFPGETVNQRVLRADGLGIPALLEAILPLVVLDTFVPFPLAMMAPVPGDSCDPEVETRYRTAAERAWKRPGIPAGTILAAQQWKVERVERFAFYERCRKAFAVVMTGELAKYGNIIIKKGVTPIV